MYIGIITHCPGVDTGGDLSIIFAYPVSVVKVIFSLSPNWSTYHFMFTWNPEPQILNEDFITSTREFTLTNPEVIAQSGGEIGGTVEDMLPQQLVWTVAII